MKNLNVEALTQTIRETLLQLPNFTDNDLRRQHGEPLIKRIDNVISLREIEKLTEKAINSDKPQDYLQNTLERLISKYSKGGEIEIDRRKLWEPLKPIHAIEKVNLDTLSEKLRVDPIPFEDMTIYCIYLELRIIQRLKDELGYYPENPKLENPTRLVWNGSQNALVDIFYQLKMMVNQKGRPLLESSNEEIAHFIISNFESFKDVRIKTVTNILEQEEKRPKKGTNKIVLTKGFDSE